LPKDTTIKPAISAPVEFQTASRFKELIKPKFDKILSIFIQFAKEKPVFTGYFIMFALFQVHLDVMLPSDHVSLGDVRGYYILTFPMNFKSLFFLGAFSGILLLFIPITIVLFNINAKTEHKTKRIIVLVMLKGVLILNYLLYAIIGITFYLFLGYLFYLAIYTNDHFFGLDPQKLLDIVNDYPVMFAMDVLVNNVAIIISIYIIYRIKRIDSVKIVKFFTLEENKIDR
jgi:hypothetical protein